MTGNCASKATNWWCELIQNSCPNSQIIALPSFKQLLEQRLQYLISYHGAIRISTFNNVDRLLEETAYAAKLPVNIPKGYEMRIMIDKVSIYNSSGTLVENF